MQEAVFRTALGPVFLHGPRTTWPFLRLRACVYDRLENTLARTLHVSGTVEPAESFTIARRRTPSSYQRLDRRRALTWTTLKKFATTAVPCPKLGPTFRISNIRSSPSSNTDAMAREYARKRGLSLAAIKIATALTTIETGSSSSSRKRSCVIRIHDAARCHRETQTIAPAPPSNAWNEAEAA